MNRSILGRVGMPIVAMALGTACPPPTPQPSVVLTPDNPSTLDDIEAVVTLDSEPEPGIFISYKYNWEVRPAGAPADAWEAAEEILDARVPASMTEKGQAWRLSVTASDGASTKTASMEEGVVVQNTLPEMLSVRLSPTAGVDTFGTLTVTSSSTDIDDDDVSVTYTWYVNGTPLDVEGDQLTGEYFGKNDVITVEAIPYDGEGEGAPMMSGTVTIVNTPPSLSGVEVSPNEVRESDEIRCEPVGWLDVDEDPPTVIATWLVNGVEIDGVSGPLNGYFFDKGDLIRCQGVPTDGDSVGDMVVSEVVTVLNSPPSVSGAVLSMSAPSAADTLTVVPVGLSDPDEGDTITVTTQWYVDGEMVFEGAELPARSFIKGQEIYAIITPTDGLETGESVKSDVATSVNTPPRITKIDLIPDPLYTDSVAFPKVEVEDLDGDRISYTKEWRLNGVTMSETSASLDGSVHFDKGDTLQVVLTPNDGEADGPTEESVVVTVLNSAPTVPEISVDPEKPKSDDDLWCIVELESTDADGDDLTYDITWTQNGVEFTDADTVEYDGDLVDFSYTADKDYWECTLVVSDGEDSVEVSSGVDVLDWAGPRNFSNCGKSGYLGPSTSNCNSTYSGTNLEGNVTVVNGGWQEWEVPQDGTYRIEASGAQGGRGRYGYYNGYNGARMRGDFSLKEGEKLRILVGQMGQSSGGSYAAGGGGASWVMKSDGTVLLAAAGGGANGYAYYSSTTCAGQSGSRARRYTSTSIASSCSTSYTSEGYGGSYQYRYSYGSRYYYGGGGAGYRGDGTYYSSTCRSRAYRANHSSYPGRGADGWYGDGGFGGGGCGGYSYRYSWSWYTYRSSSYGSGGGGGYTGGSGGYGNGGGGGSKNTGSSQSNSSNSNGGNGKVTLDLAP